MDFNRLQKIMMKLEKAMRDILDDKHIDPQQMNLSFAIDSFSNEPIVKINGKEIPREIMKEFSEELRTIFDDEDDLFSMFDRTRSNPFNFDNMFNDYSNVFRNINFDKFKSRSIRTKRSYRGFRDCLENNRRSPKHNVDFDNPEKEYMQDVFEDEDGVHFILELPSGTKKEDIDIKAHENEISVQGIIIKSPCKIVSDKSKASFRNGILELVFKKK